MVPISISLDQHCFLSYSFTYFFLYQPKLFSLILLYYIIGEEETRNNSTFWPQWLTINLSLSSYVWLTNCKLHFTSAILYIKQNLGRVAHLSRNVFKDRLSFHCTNFPSVFWFIKPGPWSWTTLTLIGGIPVTQFYNLFMGWHRRGLS